MNDKFILEQLLDRIDDITGMTVKAKNIAQYYTSEDTGYGQSLNGILESLLFLQGVIGKELELIGDDKNEF